MQLSGGCHFKNLKTCFLCLYQAGRPGFEFIGCRRLKLTSLKTAGTSKEAHTCDKRLNQQNTSHHLIVKNEAYVSRLELRVGGELSLVKLYPSYTAVRDLNFCSRHVLGKWLTFPSGSSADQLGLFPMSNLGSQVLSVSSHGLGQCFSECRLEQLACFPSSTVVNARWQFCF